MDVLDRELQHDAGMPHACHEILVRLSEAAGRRLRMSDRRGQAAVLTDEGFATLAAAAPGHVEGARRHLFDALSSAQVDQLRRISETLADHLTDSGPN
ncbi:hypothetical protein [Micromonospora sp. CNB394]|uniref:hypothetical protein n=1 Tax=Micromonospora sp. CNB394 TaxID=1169151 RepID=UPI000362B4C8|nr:hypothetical protein [Micromonospora sp. CNB394]